MDVQLVALDIDGTLLDSQGNLPAENVEAIRKTAERGIKVILVTGRRFVTAQRIASVLKLHTPLIAHNGALIRFPFREDRLDSCFLSPQAASVVLEATVDFLPYTVLHMDKPPDGQLVVHSLTRTNPPLRTYLDKVPPAVHEVDSLQDLLDGDIIQIMFSGELKHVQAIENRLLHSTVLQWVRISKTYYPSKNIGIMDILDWRCSKGRALAFLADYYGHAPGQILAIGDNHNDLEMLEYAGLGVVVANCVEDLRGRGFEETTSNDDLGVARALTKYCV